MPGSTRSRKVGQIPELGNRFKPLREQRGAKLCRPVAVLICWSLLGRGPERSTSCSHCRRDPFEGALQRPTGPSGGRSASRGRPGTLLNAADPVLTLVGGERGRLRSLAEECPEERRHGLGVDHVALPLEGLAFGVRDGRCDRVCGAVEEVGWKVGHVGL